jgi:hypothetical protein
MKYLISLLIVVITIFLLPIPALAANPACYELNDLSIVRADTTNPNLYQLKGRVKNCRPVDVSGAEKLLIKAIRTDISVEKDVTLGPAIITDKGEVDANGEPLGEISNGVFDVTNFQGVNLTDFGGKWRIFLQYRNTVLEPNPTVPIDLTAAPTFPTGTAPLPTAPKAKGTGETCTANPSGTTPWEKEGIQTAIGCIPTNPSGLISAITRLLTGVGGGIALLLMIFGAFRMITSQGNPDAIKEGSEQFTSALIGLLFIVFAVLLLKIIGVDILGLPGFGP